MRFFGVFFLTMFLVVGPAHAAMTEYPKARLKSLDKITARTMTFDAAVGSTVKFGSLYIKVLSCQKPDLEERFEAAAFLQVWEITADDVSKWIFSGWMFASSPALSAMDHPIYDVWVTDCLPDPNAPVKPVIPTDISDVVREATQLNPASADVPASLNPPSVPIP